VLKGHDLFNATVFRDAEATKIFYKFIATLKVAIDLAAPSPTHCFIKILDLKGKLLRSYTQNIDGFEDQVDLTGTTSSSIQKIKGKINHKVVRNVQLHGDIQ